MRTDEYQRIYQNEDTHWWYRSLHALAREAMDRHGQPHPTVLDLGCGTGGFMQGLRSDMRGLGVDFHPEALRLARTRSSTPVCRASAESIPLADACVDVVVCLDVLYHSAVATPADAMREMARVLRPGGILVLNVPAYEYLRSGHDIVIHTARRFTRRDVAELLHGAALERLELTHWNTLLFPGAALVRLTRRNRTESDLRAIPAWANRMMAGLLGVERKMLNRLPLPFGLSIFAVARK